MKDLQMDGPEITNAALLRWIKKTAAQCKPERVHICDGSREENVKLCNQMIESGTFIRLNEEKRPNSFLCR